MKALLRFRTDESGATAIEYALIATLIAVAIIASVTLAGESVQTLYESISSKVALALGSVS
jgi:pilus assembly protein Flp/PilA